MSRNIDRVASCSPSIHSSPAWARQANAAVSYDKVVSYGIRRCEFDHYLLERSGARLRLGENVEVDAAPGRPLAGQW